MEDDVISEKAKEEIQSRTLGVTQQFLDIHEVDLSDRNQIRIDSENDDGTAIVYFPVKGQKFSFSVYVDTSAECTVRFVGTEPYVFKYFRAVSSNLDFLELAAYTILPYSKGWSKGDKRRSGNATY